MYTNCKLSEGLLSFKTVLPIRYVHNLTSLNCCYIWKQLYPSGIHIAYYCYELMVCLETFLPFQYVHYLWPLWIAAVCVILLPIQYVNYLLAFWTDAVFGKISTHITCVLHINTELLLFQNNNTHSACTLPDTCLNYCCVWKQLYSYNLHITCHLFDLLLCLELVWRL